ncbi:MAG: tetratricopeptide repeat protein, partial [Deltaproteobacteria bacterium]|nr:tetratricopeptide repeat protein [Deltaproteobacteria bacterium]
MAGPVSDKARVTVMRARQLLREKRYADALQVCADELARGADEPRLRLVAAHSLLAQGRHEGAKKEAQQVLRVDSGVAEAHRLLADVACARGEVATACDHLERVITLEPSDGQARRLLESLSRTPMSGGDETVPMSGAMQISGQASSLDRFVADDELGMSDHLDAQDDEDYIESSLGDSILEISDSMMEELPDQPKKKEPQSKAASADPVVDWMPPGVSAGPAPMTLLGLDGLPPDGSEEDAPTMPLLRPSAPKEPELKLDPRAARPVQQERVARRLSRSAEVDLAPERGPITAPVSSSQLVSVEDEAEDNGFEEFGIEAASAPVSRGEAQEIPKVRDPVQAREEMHRAASKASSSRRPQRDSADFVAIEEEEDSKGEGGELMSMFTVGSDAAGADDSLDDVSARRSSGTGGSEAPETLDGGSLGGFDDGFDADPALDGAGGDGTDDDSWDPLADMGGSGGRSNADPD